jgi:hypothetical protein
MEIFLLSTRIRRKDWHSDDASFEASLREGRPRERVGEALSRSSDIPPKRS